MTALEISQAPKVDLVLEGGGVKGIGLVGAVLTLSEKGYVFPRVAGGTLSTRRNLGCQTSLPTEK